MRPEIAKSPIYPQPRAADLYEETTCLVPRCGYNARFAVGYTCPGTIDPHQGVFVTGGWAACGAPMHLAHVMVMFSDRYELMPNDIWVGKISSAHANLVLRCVNTAMAQCWINGQDL